jgi:hypothetical protein
MTKLEIVNQHPNDRFIYFDAAKHAYSTKKCPYFKSVTGVISKQFSKFDADAVISRMKPGNKKYKGMSPGEIKRLWNKKGKESSKSGTLLHAQIENYYNAEEIEVEPGDVALEQFLEWDVSFLSEREWSPFRVEWKVFDEESRIAGTIDAVFTNNKGEYVLVDWKRCNSIDMNNRFQKSSNPALNHLPDCKFVKYSLQLNLYKYILQKNYGLTVAGMYIVNMHPEQSTFKTLEALDLTREIDIIVGKMSSDTAIALPADQITVSDLSRLLKKKGGLKISGTLYIDED